MIIAAIVTPWTGTGAPGDLNRPLLADVFSLARWQDVTGQDVTQLLPEPNSYTVEVRCDAPTLAAIEADDRFFVLGWQEEEEIL